MLHAPADGTRQVAASSRWCDAHHYAGIDLDYENLHAGDRQAFTAFVTRPGGCAARARARFCRSRCSPRPRNAGYAPAQRRPGLRGHRPGRRPGAADGLRLPLGHLSARPGRPGRLDPRRAALRQDPDPGQQDRSRYPAVRLRLVRRPRHRDQLAAGPPAVPAVPRAAALRRSQPGPVVQLYRRAPATSTPCGSRTRRAPGRSSTWPRRPGSAASTCGCTATRTRAPGRRCARCCPSSGSAAPAPRRRRHDAVVGAGHPGLRRELRLWGSGRPGPARRPDGPWAGGTAPTAGAPASRENVVGAQRRRPGARRARQSNLTVDDVAVLIPAHNEALVIEESLRAIMELVPARERPCGLRRIDRRHGRDRPALPGRR